MSRRFLMRHADVGKLERLRGFALVFMPIPDRFAGTIACRVGTTRCPPSGLRPRARSHTARRGRWFGPGRVYQRSSFSNLCPGFPVMMHHCWRLRLALFYLPLRLT